MKKINCQSGRILSKKEVSNVFSLLKKTWPEAKCELQFRTAYELLLAVVLSAQATDKAVNKALGPIWLEYCPNFSPEDLIQMGEYNFYNKIKSIGLAPTKAKNCYKLSQILIEKYNSEIFLQRDILESLPGVGRKTANVLLNVLARQATMPVDTHVERLSQRIGLVPRSLNRLTIENALIEIIPEQYLLEAHHLLIFHGRYTCLSRNPKCHGCCLNAICAKNGLEKK